MLFVSKVGTISSRSTHRICLARRLLASRHSFSSSSLASSSPPSSQADNNDDNGEQLLYERNTDRNRIPQVAFGASVFNTLYWLWYALDFIPAVNASPSPDLHIDPAIGAGGVALGILINSVTLLYPSMTLSKVTYQQDTQTFQVYKHSLLPMIRPSLAPIHIKLGSMTMDNTSSETKKILDELGADMRRYQGHLGIRVKGKRIPFLLEIRDPHEVKDGDLLLQALLDPHAIRRELVQQQKQKQRTKKQQRSKKGKRSGGRPKR